MAMGILVHLPRMCSPPVKSFQLSVLCRPSGAQWLLAPGQGVSVNKPLLESIHNRCPHWAGVSDDLTGNFGSRNRVLDQRRVIILAGVMLAVISIAWLACWAGYRAELARHKQFLVSIAATEAKLITYLHLQGHSTGQPGFDQTAQILRDMARDQTRILTFGKSGEIVVAWANEGIIEFLVARHDTLGMHGEQERQGATLAEPMALALANQQGVTIATDYRGATVLAAYQPVADTPFGVVVKEDLVDQQSSFIKAGLVASGSGIALVLVGFLFLQLSTGRLARQVAEGEEKYRTLIDTIREGLCSVDKDFKITFVNRRFCEMLGYTEEELLGRMIDSCIAPRDQTVLEHQRKLRDQGADGSYQLTMQRKDGGEFACLVSPRPEYDRSGTVVGSVAVITDISEQQRIQEELHKSREDLSKLFSEMLDGIAVHEIILDPQGVPVDYRFIDVNPAFERMTGLRGEDIIGKTVLDVLPETEEHWIETYGQVALTGEPVHFEQYSGELESYFEVTAYQPEQGQFACIFQDVTDRRRAQDILKSSEEKFRTVIDQAGEAIYLVDADFRLRDVNQQACSTTGYTRQELLEMNVADVDPLATAERLMQVTKLLKEGLPVTIESENKHKDGSVNPVELRICMVEIKGESHALVLSRDISKRKQYEEDLAASEQRYHSLFDEAPIPYQSLDQAGCILEVNQAWLDVLGYEHGAVIGKWFGEFLASEYRDHFIEWFPCFQDAGRIQNIEFEMVTAQDARVLVSYDGVIAKDRDGGFLRTHCVVVDITERRRMELVQEAQLRLVMFADMHSTQELLVKFLDEAEFLTGSQIGFYHFIEDDQETVYLQAWSTNTTAEVCSAEGEPRHYPISQAGVWVDCVRELKPVVHNDYQSLEHKRGLPEGHAPVIRQLVVPVIRGGKIVAILGVGNKVTDYQDSDVQVIQQLAESAWETVVRKRAEEEIKKFRTISEKAVHGNAIADLEGNLIYLNDYFARVHGYEVEELLGKSLSLFHNESQLAEVTRINEQLIRNGAYEPMEIWHCHRDGSEFPMLMSGVVLRDEDGEPQFLVATAIDITDRVKLEDQLRQTRKLEAIGTLAGGIAHDFNNVLYSILGNVDLAMMKLPPSNPAQKNLKEVAMAGQRAANLVRQILTFARETGKRRGPVDVVVILKEVVKLLRSTIPATIEILHEIDTTRSKVMADPTEIHQVIMNLCANAGQAMKQGPGVLDVRLQELAVDEYLARQNPDLEQGPHLVLSVSDTGPGIPPEVQEHIFEPFFTTKESGEGTGLGLAVVHGIVTDLGGVINVNSTHGRGTVFKVYLPLLETGESDAGEEERPVLGGTERIMVVDDEEAIRRMIGEVLGHLGYHVDLFSDGVAALERFNRDPEAYDLVITDQTMPKMTGVELAQNVLKARPATPIVLCTGFSSAVSSEDAQEMGISSFIMKPVTYSSLAATVREVLDGPDNLQE